MLDVIDFFFGLLRQIWSLIVANWLFAIGFLLLVLNWVISLINGTSHDQ